MTETPTPEALPLPPVKVSGAAHKALADLMRRWSGWPAASLILGDPSPVSLYGKTDPVTREFTVNVDALSRNPNRVLSTVNPFRLRQEAILTGVMLHEAAHARYTLWRPRSQAERDALRLNDQPVSDQTLALASLLEEARIEHCMRDAECDGDESLRGLTWTMPVAAAGLLPLSEVSMDPDQQAMDVLRVWILRVGRRLPSDLHKGWALTITRLLEQAVDRIAPGKTNEVLRLVRSAINSRRHHSTGGVLHAAQEILKILYPNSENPEDTSNAPMPSGGCATGEAGEGEAGEGEAGEAGEAGEGEAGEGEAGEEAGATSSTPERALSAALAKAEAEANDEAEAEAMTSGGSSAGVGNEGADGDGWRKPSSEERQTQKQAEHFLRSLIEPSELATVSLSDSPSATVDPAALASWKAGGQVKPPTFFRQTRRAVEPSPPVKIAILVDVSGSMDVLQEPSAVLSWALSAAALDLRNFAGRGRQVESCLIHWGSLARVIQKNGETLPGIHETNCLEGTRAMHEAFDLVEGEMPGFFAPGDHPENRLIVQFTDWGLALRCAEAMRPRLAQARTLGVNMLTIAPEPYRFDRRIYDDVVTSVEHPLGREHVTYYDGKPNHVWTEAANM
ncbi:MAG TPA: hypothetical protein VLC09_14040, partial [Polyangiaceae bacterium]|nr:hypothetical protein [Polyangiaceae bacterium]